MEVTNHKLSTVEVLEKELYDHLTDSKETQNVVADVRYKDIIAELAQTCKERKDVTDHNHNFN